MKWLTTKTTDLRSFFEDRIARPWPLVRICLWCLLFLFVIDSAYEAVRPISKVSGVDGDGFRYMVSGRGTLPVGYYQDFPPKAEDEYRIAWVSGSSVLVRSKAGDITYLPQELAKTLKAPDGKRVTMAMYYINAGKTFDQYLTVLQAVEQDPDLIIVTLNPLWGFVNKAPSFRNDLYPSNFPLVGAYPEALFYYFSFASPTDALEGFSRGFMRNLDTRYNRIPKLLKKMRFEIVGRLGMDKFGGTQSAEGRGHGVETTARPQPIFFWSKYEDNEVAGKDHRAFMINYFDFNPQGVNAKIYRLMAQAIQDSEIKSLWYSAPFPHQVYADHPIGLRLDFFNDFMKELQASMNTMAHFIFLNPGHPLGDEDFWDYVHLKSAQRLAPLLEEGIQDHMENGQ